MKVKIKDTGKVVTGKTPPTADPKNFGKGYLFITPVDLHTDNNVITHSQRSITERGFKSIKSNTISGLSVLVGCIGWDMGNVALVKGTCAINQQINAITNIKTELYNPYYIYYWLKLRKQYLFRIANVTRTPILNKAEFENIEIDFPSKKKQDSLVKILRNIDSKIANNNAISKELESMAKTIYDYWFLQFEFPDKDGKPYKSNGGKMIWNDQLKRKIPEGWKVKSLSSYASVGKGKLLTAKETNLKGKYKVVSAGRDFSYHHDQYNRLENTITVSASGANAGFVRLWYEKIYANDCTTVRGKNTGETDYIFNFLKSAQSYLYQNAHGSAQPHVYPKDIKNIPVIIPSKEVMKKYISLVSPFNKKISIIVKQNKELKSLRNFLLPMLMNGQVTIAD